jgi:hypothetical protein
MVPVYVFPRNVPEATAIDGIILLDSLAFNGSLSNISSKSDMYLESALECVYARTKLRCMGVLHDGAEYDLLDAAYDARRKLDSMGINEVSFCVIIDTGGIIFEYVERQDDVRDRDRWLPADAASGMEKVYRYSRKYLANTTLVVYGGPGVTWKYPGAWAEAYDWYVNKTIQEIKKFANVVQGLCLRDLDEVDDDDEADVSRSGSVVGTFVSWVSLAAVLRSKL